MIARALLYVPYPLIFPKDVRLAPLTRTDSELNLQITIHPPAQLIGTQGLLPQLAQTPVESEDFIYNDGATCEMNALLIEIRGPESSLCDRITGDGKNMNPAMEIAFKYANELLETLRSLTNDPSIRPLDGGAFISFFEDDGSPVVPGQGKVALSLRPQQPVVTSHNPVIDSDLWILLQSSNQKLMPHQDLLLDARAIFPEPSSITLAFTALESACKLAIRRLSDAVSPKSFGKWISQNYREPRIEQLIKGPLKGLSGIDLTEESDIWQAFKTLLDVRNQIVHEGRMLRNRKPISRPELLDVLNGAEKVIRRIEEIAIVPRPISGRSGTVTVSANMGIAENTPKRITYVPPQS